jgi:hypothetical protein
MIGIVISVYQGLLESLGEAVKAKWGSENKGALL